MARITGPPSTSPGEVQVTHADITALQHVETGAGEEFAHFLRRDRTMAMKTRQPSSALARRGPEVRHENAPGLSTLVISTTHARLSGRGRWWSIKVLNTTSKL